MKQQLIMLGIRLLIRWFLSGNHSNETLTRIIAKVSNDQFATDLILVLKKHFGLAWELVPLSFQTDMYEDSSKQGTLIK